VYVALVAVMLQYGNLFFTQDIIIYIGAGVRSAGGSDAKLRLFSERMVFPT
jgi:hypothetical protein